jgi:hypothetical protein
MPMEAWQALSTAASGLSQALSMLNGHGQVPGQAGVAFTLPPPASGSPTASSGRSRSVAYAVPSTSGGAQRAQLSSETFAQPKADSSAEEDGDEFEVLSSSSVEEQDESKSLLWAEVVAAVQAFHPEAVAKEESSSLGRRSWAVTAASSSGQLVESPLILEETEKALSKLRNCDFDASRQDSSELPDFPSAQKMGSFLSCPKRAGLFKAPVKLKLLPKERLRASRHDLALAGNLESMPKELSVPTRGLASLHEMLSRSLELVSVLDSLSLALGKVASGAVAGPSMSADQALPILLQAVDQLAQKMAVYLSGAYVNSLLLKRDALLKRSSLQSAFKSSLRAVAISSQSLFGPCAKAAVDESAKRTTDEAFAAIARQGKRSQPARSQPAKRPRFSGAFSGSKDSYSFRTPSRPFGRGRGRGSRRPSGGTPAKQSKGGNPQ